MTRRGPQPKPCPWDAETLKALYEAHTLRELADMAGVSYMTVQRWLHALVFQDIAKGEPIEGTVLLRMTCAVCGEPFIRARSLVHGPTVYCSNLCRRIGVRARMRSRGA